MRSAILWAIIVGIAGTLVSVLAALFETVVSNRDTRRRIHIVPSDETIARPSDIHIYIDRTY